MLQTSTTKTTAKSKQRIPGATSRNPEPIALDESKPVPDFALMGDAGLLEKQMPEMLSKWLKQATAEFIRLRDGPSSDKEAFDAAAGSMDAIYSALITQPSNRPSVVALQLAAVAAYASLHASKDEPPELDEASTLPTSKRWSTI